MNLRQKALQYHQLAINTYGVCTPKIGVNNFVGTYVIVSVYDVGGVSGLQLFPWSRVDIDLPNYCLCTTPFPPGI